MRPQEYQYLSPTHISSAKKENKAVSEITETYPADLQTGNLAEELRNFMKVRKDLLPTGTFKNALALLLNGIYSKRLENIFPQLSICNCIFTVSVASAGQ